MKKLIFPFLLIVGFGISARAQGVRFDSQITQVGTIVTTTNAVVVPANPIVKVCNAPANAVPCSNLATTYTDSTLVTPCSTSTQLVLAGTTNCVASPDGQNNWGVWVNSGQYAYTVTVSGSNFGPYYFTAGSNGSFSSFSSDPATCTPASATQALSAYFNTTIGRLRYCSATNTWSDWAYPGVSDATKPILAIDSGIRPDAAAGTYTGNWVTNGSDLAVQILDNSFQPNNASSAAGSATSAIYSENTGAIPQVPGGLPSTAGWPNNQGGRVTVVLSSGSTDVVGAWARASTSADTGYLCFAFGGTGNAAGATFKIRKYVATVQTDLETYSSQTYNIGDTLSCEATGTTITMYQNGVALSPAASDSSIASGSPGMFLNNATGFAALSNFIGYATDTSVFSGTQIIFAGDSIISRWNLRRQFTTKAFANAGVGSQTSTEILARFPTEVIANQPAAVVIEGGRNGIALGTETEAQTFANMQAMGNLARNSGIQVIFTSTIQSCNLSDPAGLSTKIDALNVDVAAEVAAHPGDLLVDWNGAVDNQPAPTTCKSADYLADLIHPNTAGYALMAPLVPTITAITGNLLGLNGLFAPLHSGVIPASAIPAPTSSSLGGVDAITCPANEFVSAIPVACSAATVTPTTPGWSVRDSFQQSNGALSSNWTLINGSVTVASQIATGANNGLNNFAVWTASTTAADQFSQVRVRAINSADFVGPLARASGSGATRSAYYFVVGGSGDPTCYLAKEVSGTQTTLTSTGTGCGSLANGDILTLWARGTAPATLIGFRNGVQVITTTDSSLTTGSPGFFPGDTGSTSVDDWVGGNLPSVIQPSPQPYYIFPETTAPAGVLTTDLLYGDSSGHCVKGIFNNDSASCLARLSTFAAPPAIGNTTPAAGTFTSATETDASFGSQQINTASACETSFATTTLGTGATTTDTGLNCLPGNSIIDAVVYRITTTITTSANFTVGDGATAARFCGTQSTLTSGTTGICFVQADQTGAGGPRQSSAAKVRVTLNANPGAGAIRFIVYYHTWVAPTS